MNDLTKQRRTEALRVAFDYAHAPENGYPPPTPNQMLRILEMMDELAIQSDVLASDPYPKRDARETCKPKARAGFPLGGNRAGDVPVLPQSETRAAADDEL